MNMKKIARIIAITAIGASIFLSACAPPPPPVSRDQLSQAEQAMTKISKETKKLKGEKDALQKEFNEKQAKLNKLLEYQKELGME